MPDDFEHFHIAIQQLGRAYLQACLAVPVPPELEGKEAYAVLAMAIGVCKAVGIDDARILEVAEKFVHGGVTFRPHRQA